jgi:hypothetical protein
MRQRSANRRAKARQASKLAEIREALIAAGCDTAAKQASVLGVGRSTAWALLNLDKRAGPTAIVIKRILSSPNLPPVAKSMSRRRLAACMAIASGGRSYFATSFATEL